VQETIITPLGLCSLATAATPALAYGTHQRSKTKNEQPEILITFSSVLRKVDGTHTVELFPKLRHNAKHQRRYSGSRKQLPLFWVTMSC